jgi:hypothetical protein
LADIAQIMRAIRILNQLDHPGTPDDDETRN